MIEALYTEFHIYLLARCTALCRDGATAEDLVQETFLRALTHMGVLQVLRRAQRREGFVLALLYEIFFHL